MVDVLLAVVVFLWITYLWENYLSYRQVRPLIYGDVSFLLCLGVALKVCYLGDIVFLQTST